MGFSLILIEVKLLQEETLSLNIFYLLECAKRIRHKLNILMKSSPIYNKLQQTYEVFSYIISYNII